MFVIFIYFSAANFWSMFAQIEKKIDQKLIKIGPGPIFYQFLINFFSIWAKIDQKLVAEKWKNDKNCFF